MDCRNGPRSNAPPAPSSASDRCRDHHQTARRRDRRRCHRSVMLAFAARARVRASSVLIAIGLVPCPCVLLLGIGKPPASAAIRYELLWGPNHSIGLHDDPCGNPHTPWRAVMLAIKYAVQLNWTGRVAHSVLLSRLRGSRLARRRAAGRDPSRVLRRPSCWSTRSMARRPVRSAPGFCSRRCPALLIPRARAPFLIADRAGGGGGHFRANWRSSRFPVHRVTWLRS